MSGASGHHFRRCSTSSDSSSSALPRRLLPVATKVSEALVVTPALDDSNFDTLVNLSDQQITCEQASGMLSTSNSADLLSISPIFGKPFDTQSLVEDDLTRGIRNINYDIEFIDSPENSMAEEIAEIRKYTSIANDVKNEVDKTTKGGSAMSMSKSDLEEFDPLMMRDKETDTKRDSNLTRSLIDESPNDTMLLDNPLLPMISKIKAISCETGGISAKK